MKLFRNLGLLLCMFTFSYSALANNTGQVKHFKNLKKVSLKCYVQLIGGKSTILYHYDLPEKLRQSFTRNLPQSNYFSNKQKKIYKVNECVELDEKFSEEIANSLHTKLKEQG